MGKWEAIFFSVLIVSILLYAGYSLPFLIEVEKEHIKERIEIEKAKAAQVIKEKP